MSGDGPFEWLAGGLFFGKSAKGGIESIDSSKDVLALFRGVSQSLDEILAADGDAATTAETTTPDKDPPSKFLAARLARIRFLLYDERRVPHESRSKSSVTGMAVQAVTGDELQDLIPKLLQNLDALPFESRKDVAAIFNYLLVSGLEGSDAQLYQPLMEFFHDYVKERFDEIMTILVNGHDPSKAVDVGLHFGSMYRACMRHACLYAKLVGTTESATKYVFPFLDTFVHVPNFELASDSMETLRLVLTGGGDKVKDEAAKQEMATTCAEFLTRDYAAIWDERFCPKLLSESANYMTRRVALQILSTVLLTRSNYAVMIQFVASRSNLILVMKLLRDTSPHITLDAFHVFKVFVANPNKPPQVVTILKDNKVKLCKYLTTLHQDKESTDTQFRDEKALIIATIDAL